MNSPKASARFLLFGVFLSLLWHFFWCIGLVPVLSRGPYEKARGQTIYAGAFLKLSDFFPPPSQAARYKSVFSALDRPEGVPRPALEKIEGDAPKPEILLDASRPSAKISGVNVERPDLQKSEGEAGDVGFGMSDYDRYLYQADFSDIRRAASREALSHVIVFQVFLDDKGRVARIKKISGSGDPPLDLFIQSKIDNAVFKPDAAPRGRWITVRFSLR
ncbi:MAG: hypothetical protein ACE14U_07500 [Candidatus Velamenicoccus archaeovorus]